MQRLGTALVLDIDHHVTHVLIGLQVLRGDVDAGVGEALVDAGQHARHVAVDVQDPAQPRVSRQRDLGEIDRRQRGAVVAVADELGGHLAADALLGLASGTTDVRREQHVLEADERGLEVTLVTLGLDREHVDGGTQDVLRLQGRSQRVDVDHGAARGIDEEAALLHASDLLGTHHVLRVRRLGHVQAHHVGLGQQLVQRGELACIAQRQLGLDVVEHHAHAQGLGQQAQLGADMAIADDAQRLATHLERVGSALHPAAPVQQCVLLRDAAHQHDDLGQHQLGHAARVGERRVEHGHATLGCGIQGDLVGPDAEGTDSDQLVGLLQHLGRELGARAQPHEVGIGNGIDQCLPFQRLGVSFDLGVPVGSERFDGGRMDAFQQHHLQFVSFERETHAFFLGYDTTNGPMVARLPHLSAVKRISVAQSRTNPPSFQPEPRREHRSNAPVPCP